MENLITFTAGASYGLTTVAVGQPLDTIKTRLQGMPALKKSNMLQVAREVFLREGMRGLYRGGMPLVFGGSMMRSAQFGVSGVCNSFLEQANIPHYRFFGVDSHVAIAGVAGGLGRGLVEGPTDFLKVRRQVENKWTLNKIFDGMGVTLLRNTFLFSAFVIYIDLSKQACAAGLVPASLSIPDGSSLSPFAKGAICANLAWLTIWPWDVVKTQRQSGNHSGGSAIRLLVNNFKEGVLFKGLVPGLARSTIANGCSMVAYEFVHRELSMVAGVKRKDLV